MPLQAMVNVRGQDMLQDVKIRAVKNRRQVRTKVRAQKTAVGKVLIALHKQKTRK